MQFQGDNGTYDVFETKNGELTLYSNAFEEACHSLSGPGPETIHNFIEGCQLDSRVPRVGEHSILEVGFGIGLGAQKTFDFFQQERPEVHCHFVSLELDAKLVLWAAKNIPQVIHSDYPNLHDLKLGEESGVTFFQAKKDKGSYTIIIGDATTELLKFHKIFPKQKFSSIFQDPFSPKKNPTLWTTKWFESLKEVSKDNAILSTYSASSSIRKNMEEAGFSVFNRKGFAEKRSCTYALV
jgi:tRNA U34 5-methylaminomethyl-2-thiouridine-forming methyltransferase MnmC